MATATISGSSKDTLALFLSFTGQGMEGTETRLNRKTADWAVLDDAHERNKI